MSPVVLATSASHFASVPRQGERVLIHAATGGVGLVAVQFAQRVGATIFATAGSPGKVQHLRDMGVKYITSSRDAKDTGWWCDRLFFLGLGRFLWGGSRSFGESDGFGWLKNNNVMIIWKSVRVLWLCITNQEDISGRWLRPLLKSPRLPKTMLVDSLLQDSLLILRHGVGTLPLNDSFWLVIWKIMFFSKQTWTNWNWQPTSKHRLSDWGHMGMRPTRDPQRCICRYIQANSMPPPVHHNIS